MPVSPGATESLSGGAGTTRVALVQRIVRDRFDDNPYTERSLAAIDGSTNPVTVTVKPGAQTRFQEGMWVDFLDDATFETLLIESVPNDTTFTARRAHRGTTIAAHLANAVFRVEGRVNPQAVSNMLDEAMEDLWPDVFDVRHVSWSVPDPTDYWYILPSDAEAVSELYQRDTGTTTDLKAIENWGGPWLLDTGFLGGSNTKAVQAYKVRTNAPDDKLHAVYLAKVQLSKLTTFQQTLLTYDVASRVMASEFASESKPERRSGLEGAPDAGSSFRFFDAQAGAARKREAKRLADFLPRKSRRQYRGMRHYQDMGFINPNHPVRDS